MHRQTKPLSLLLAPVAFLLILMAGGPASRGVEPVPGAGVVSRSAPSKPGPWIEPRVYEVLASSGSAVVHVVLKEHRLLPRRPTAAERGRYLEDVAAAHAAIGPRLRAAGVRITAQRRWSFAFTAEVDSGGLRALSTMPGVEKIYANRERVSLLEQSVPLINADILQANGFRGGGMSAAVIDTGIFLGNPEFGTCSQPGSPGCRVLAGFNFCDSPVSTDIVDLDNHGTPIAGIISSESGIAPDAGLIVLKIEQSPGGVICSAWEPVADAMEWILDHHADYDIKVVNLSQAGVGGATCPDQAGIAGLIGNLVQMNIAVIVASGNDRFDNNLSFPACVAQATAVGAVYDATFTHDICSPSTVFMDDITCFSNLGDGLDLVAPGHYINAPANQGGLSGFSGTSFATPMVAGAFLQLFQVAPNADVEQIENALKLTGHPSTRPGLGVTYPRIDVEAAALELCPVIPNPEVCDGLDNDCNGTIDNGFNVGVACAAGVGACTASGVFVCDAGGTGTVCNATPGAPVSEACDGLDNDCDGAIPPAELDIDADGFRACNGDCDDTSASVRPGGVEVCDGVNNDCLDPTWPALAVETDDDADGLAECAGDCDDTRSSVRPGAPEVCDDLDNDCDGSVDPGSARIVAQIDALGEALDPSGAAGDAFGWAALGVPDSDGDGVGDFYIGAPGRQAGSVLLYSGATRTLIRRISDGTWSALAQFGQVLASAGDVNGQGVTDIVAGGPYHKAGSLDDPSGRVALYTGEAGVRLWYYQDPANAFANLGASLAGLSDLTSDGVSEIAAGAPFACTPAGCGGTVYVLHGATGQPLASLPLPVFDPSGGESDRLGSSVAGLDDVDGDGVADFASGAPGRDLPGLSAAGAIVLFSGANGAVLRTLTDPVPASGDQLGSSLASVADLDGDGKRDLVAGAPYRDGPAGVDAGAVLVFSSTGGFAGTNGALLMRLIDPSAAAGDRFGASVAAAGDFTHDGVSEILVGAPFDDTTAGADAGSAVLFNGSDGVFLGRLMHPAPAAGDHLGQSVSSIPSVNGGPDPALLAGVPADTTSSGSGAGSAQVFEVATVGDCDGDGVPNADDNCPAVANPDQFDDDEDGVGYQCDNCPVLPNPDQMDGDNDGIGNLCDNCMFAANTDQADGDGDGTGTACDTCPSTYNPTQAYVIAPTVQVLYPNGGEILNIGSNVTLTWSAADVCGGVASVDLLLSRTGVNGTYAPIAQGIANTGAYVWTVTGPKTQGTNPTAFLKIIARDPGGNTGQDVSNQGFRIK